MHYSEGTNIIPGDAVELWLEDGGVADFPIFGLVTRSDERGVLLRRGSIAPERMKPEKGDYLVAWTDILAIGPQQQTIEPPKLTEPPELPTYYYWQPRRGGGGHWQLTLWCPDCETVHLHGGGSGETPSLGHRVEHCPPGGAYADTGYNLADPKLIQGVCDNGHDYLPDNVLISAEGLQCGKCEKARVKAAKKAANPNLKQYRTGTVSD